MKGCIAVGDIHGCSEELEGLIGLLVKDSLLSDETRLVFLGDYVDRGPFSGGVIEYLLRLREEWNCVFLMGNHDDKFLHLLENARYIQPINGEFETVLSYSDGTLERGDIAHFLQHAERNASIKQAVAQTGLDNDKKALFQMPESHPRFLGSLVLYWEEDRVIFCHGGIKTGLSEAEEMLSPAHKYDLITARGEPEDFLNISEKVQVVGHRPLQEPEMENWVCMIDTGCAQGGRLTALVIPQG